MVARSNGRRPTRVTLVEDHALFAESLDITLTMEGHQVRRVSIPTAGRSSAGLLATVLATHPHVVLLDLDLGHPFGGERLVQPMSTAGVAVVVVTGSPDRARWGECIRYGARTVLSKTAPLNDILATVRRLSQGLPVIEQDRRDELLAAWHEDRESSHASRQRLEGLTAREAEVLGLLMQGLPVRDIARTGVVSEATVRTQVKSILSKLEVSSQLAAVGLAHAVGWVPPVDQHQ